MRISIIDIRTGNIFGSVVIQPGAFNTPQVHEPDYSFEDNLLQLEGVHAKDISGSNYVTIYSTTTDEGEVIYVLDNTGLYSRRIAKLTSEGDVFLGDEYFLVWKEWLMKTRRPVV